jgi:hypothetical protein
MAEMVLWSFLSLLLHSLDVCSLLKAAHLRATPWGLQGHGDGRGWEISKLLFVLPHTQPLLFWLIVSS